MNPIGLWRSGLMRTPLVLGWSAFRRLKRYTKIKRKLHSRHARNRHWYLLDLAVDPAHQGQGLAGTLLESALRRADSESIDCYLETVNPKNVGFFEKYGFALRQQVKILNGPDIWAMLRPAK
jgi:ribosomal protein S18 acetylase RimI-like enzyme